MEYEYQSETVQNFLYGANRWKEDLASKLKTRISLSISNNFRFYKVLHDLQGILYKNHTTILRMVIVESEPFRGAVPESASVLLQWVKTDDLQQLGRCEEASEWLNNASNRSKSWLPWMNGDLDSCDRDLSWSKTCKQKLTNEYRWWIHWGFAQSLKNCWWIGEKKRWKLKVKKWENDEKFSWDFLLKWWIVISLCKNS